MASRIYDTVLGCGCMYSADGGGGLMPCQYTDDDPVQTKKCTEAHKVWEESGERKAHEEECWRRNQP